MYDDAKRSLKKYYGSSAISNSNPGDLSSSFGKMLVKEEEKSDYESYEAWKKVTVLEAKKIYTKR